MEVSQLINDMEARIDELERNEANYRAVFEHYLAQAVKVEARVAELEAAQAGPRVEQVPQPDWSQAPKWAMYWAVDTNGRAHWFQEQPFREDGEWYTADGNGEWRHLKFETSGMVALPLGCDWRTTLTARPAAVPGAGGGGGNE